MKVIFAIWRALCLVGKISVHVAVFFLWSAIAAGAGWMLVHLPDVWYVHLENQSSTSFAVAAITSYAIAAGALFLAFSCGALRMLADAYTEILLFARQRRTQRAVSAQSRPSARGRLNSNTRYVNQQPPEKGKGPELDVRPRTTKNSLPPISVDVVQKGGALTSQTNK
ncbi:hypothetical protein VSR68_08735 [Paraburkholderia phymatum]|uniref:hypothetical protein n=1 Tax=Paraburkholderia phymatum TaxID=148447 RepID=UPI00317A1734